jgi:hypothetical protein
MEVELAEIATEGVTKFTLTQIIMAVAVGVVTQLAFDVIITFTWSPLITKLVVNVEELVPAFTPFICH